MLNTLDLQDLILVGKLDIFNNSKWKLYWKNCTAQVYFIKIYYYIDNINARSF